MSQAVLSSDDSLVDGGSDISDRDPVMATIEAGLGGLSESACGTISVY